MASPLATKRLQRELKALHKTPLNNPKIVAAPNEANILEWHYVLEGPTDDPRSPYYGGIYHGKLIFPKEYPYKPPVSYHDVGVCNAFPHQTHFLQGVIMLTPNGRFHPNRRLCLSMSDFHPESWNPMWSISTILMGLYSFMLDNKPTTGSVETSAAAKRKFSKESLAFNVKNKAFCSLFPEYVDLHEEREIQRKAKAAEEGANTDGESKEIDAPSGRDGEVNGIFAVGAGIVALLSVLFVALFHYL